MSATGASQTPLEGNALVSGCQGCDGRGTYATITKVITGANWYDEATEILVADLSGIAAGDTVNKPVEIYAIYADKAPKKIDYTEFTIAFTAGATSLSYAAGVITGTAAAGTATLDVACTAKPELATIKSIVVA